MLPEPHQQALCVLRGYRLRLEWICVLWESCASRGVLAQNVAVHGVVQYSLEHTVSVGNSGGSDRLTVRGNVISHICIR